MRLIVTSQQDIAGSNIYIHLSRKYGFKEVGEFEGKPIFKKGDVQLIATRESQVYAEHLDKYFSPEFYVFASRHRSVSGERTLTVHAPGNLTEEAVVGGRSRELALSAPEPMKTALLILERTRVEKNLDYMVSMEVTHHGPSTLKKPVLFVEVGSTEKEWNDPSAVDAVSKAALAAAETDATFMKGIGVGGNHYAPRHTQFILESEAALGHLIPTYALDSFDISMFRQAVENSSATFCFLDWKGMKKAHRGRVLEMAEELGVVVRRNITNSANRVPEGFVLYKVNNNLFSLAEKMDSTRLRKVITKNKGVVFEKNGHLTSEFASQSDIRKKVLKTCLIILDSRKPLLLEGTLILEELKFDPEKAERLGLNPGPEFSKLKKGLTVKVGDQEIHPGDVLTKKTMKIKLDDETLDILKELDFFT